MIWVLRLGEAEQDKPFSPSLVISGPTKREKKEDTRGGNGVRLRMGDGYRWGDNKALPLWEEIRDGIQRLDAKRL